MWQPEPQLTHQSPGASPQVDLAMRVNSEGIGSVVEATAVMGVPPPRSDRPRFRRPQGNRRTRAPSTKSCASLMASHSLSDRHRSGPAACDLFNDAGDLMTRSALVTGGAGFIGSALCRHLVGAGVNVLNVDALTYAGNLASLSTIDNAPNYRFAKIDVCDRRSISEAFQAFQPDHVIHLAAESHVDRSITGSDAFIQTNIIGTFSMLEAARAYWQGLPRTSETGSVFCMFRPTRSMVLLATMARSPRRRPTIQVLHIPPRKPRPTTSSRPGRTPTTSPPSFRIAPTITASIIFPRS